MKPSSSKSLKHISYMQWYTTNEQGWGYLDLMWQFLQRSVLGNRSIVVLYSWDTNAILMKHIQGRNDNEMLWMYKQVYEKLDKVGIKPKTNIMDNIASSHVCKFHKHTPCNIQWIGPALPLSECCWKSYLNHQAPLYFQPVIHQLPFPKAPMGWPSPTSWIHP